MKRDVACGIKRAGNCRRGIRWIAYSALMPAALLTTGATAFGEFKICNQSAYPELSAAYGSKDADKGWASHGWWKIRQGSCATVAEGPLTKGYYYTYVIGTKRISETTASSTTWEATGEIKGSLFCIDPKERFELKLNEFIKGGKALDCEARGYETKNFKEHAVETQNYIINVQK